MRHVENMLVGAVVVGAVGGGLYLIFRYPQIVWVLMVAVFVYGVGYLVSE